MCINQNNGSYTCQCTPGFTGTNCTIANCSCLNNGTCSEISGNIVCTCQPNFTGKRCETCQPNFTGKRCDTCQPNFTGEKCETCIIKNCQTCSTETTNECVTCNSGYVPVVNSTTGGCGECHIGLCITCKHTHARLRKNINIEMV